MHRHLPAEGGSASEATNPTRGRVAAPRAAVLLHPGASVDATKLGYLRCMLALACIAVVFVDSTTTGRFADLAKASAIAYLVWAIAVVITASRGRALSPGWLCWADIAAYSWFIWLAGTGESSLVLCYFFPIVVASFSYGLSHGLVVTFVSVASVTALDLISAAATGETAFARVLIGPGILASLGSLIAYWGGQELRSKRELLLLQTLAQVPNFRRATESAISDALGRLREFYRADNAILVTETDLSHAVYSCRDCAQPALATPMADAPRALLLGAAERLAVAYRNGRDGRASAAAATLDARGRLLKTAAPLEWCEKIAEFLGARAYVCVPYAERDGGRGRLYVTSSHAFSPADLGFLLRFSSALAALVDHIQLVEELASTAVERERSRISLDIHDSTIQPYIGLRMGLEALLHDVEEDGSVREALRELLEMADLSIRDLRDYAAGLRAGPRSDKTLLAVVTEQARRYERFYGMRVDVEIDKVGLPAHVAAEVFQIISEGLSNVRRHTSANSARVRVLREERTLLVEIRNENGDRAGPAFMPRSIQQRASMLGGAVSVATGESDTVVSVRVPL